ncbi:MAG: Hpt domain-containing protein [Rhizobiales bacterium]|nr:Hpt domain-containing protein [Hyphomicrobiales bacterium]NRB13897.1 Hpt domain-containing protein [Hyphomicrobiales bacterium]
MDNNILQNLIFDIGESAAHRIFEIYKTEATYHLDNIAKGLDCDDFDLIENESHALKSASYNFGLTQIGDAMALVEKAARRKNSEQIVDIIADVSNFYKTEISKIRIL